MPSTREHVPYLVSYRALAGLNQTQLAKLSGVSKNTIGTLEKGDRRGNRLVLVRLARALGVTVADLMSRDPEKSPVGSEQS